jgi:PKD repeat protein
MKNKVLTIWFTVIFTIILFVVKPLKAQVDFTWTGNCVINPTQYTPTGVSIGSIATWQWHFGDGNMSNFPNPQHVYAVPGTYGVTLTVIDTSGITSSVLHNVIQYQLPVANFATSNPNCGNTPVQFHDLSSVVYGYITHWIWNFGDGSPIDTIVFPNNQHATHQYQAPGTYNVTLTVIHSTTLCSNLITLPVTVNPSPLANFAFSNPNIVNSPVLFNDLSQPGTGSIVQWDWNFDDPASGILNTSLLQNPSHVYSNPGTFTVYEIVTNSNGCKDTIAKSVLINPVAQIDFTFTGQCVNNPTQFTPVLNGATTTQYNWDFGDGSTSTASNPMHTYTVSGTFNVSLTVTDNFGVISNVIHAVQIFPIPIAHFTNTQACFGQPTQFTDLSLISYGTIIQWQWNFGDPASGVMNTSTAQNPEHIYTSAGGYSVQLIVTSSVGCKDTLIRQIVVHSPPPVDFTVSNNCVNALVSFTPNASVMNFSAIASWLWNFGDGTTSALQSPTHIYMAAGTYTVTLSVTDTIGCTNSVSKNLSILAIPSASFYYTFPACVQSTISFTDLSQTNGGGAIVSWQWNFGDPASGTNNTSSLQNPVHIFTIPGTYQVSLTVSNITGCYSIITMNIDVHQKPTAQFSFTTPALNQPVYFTDLSLPGAGSLVTWNWDFGDGNSSFLQNPVHTYTLPGTYTVGLNVTNEYICSSYADSLLIVQPGAGSVTLSGRVIAGNDTINNASVHLVQVDMTGLPVSLLTTTPGTANEFVFENIPEGNYYLHASPQYNGPFASAYLPTFYVNSVYWQSATLITLGQPQNPYNIQLASYQIINGGTFIINGQIVNAGKSINPADQEVLLLDNQNNPIRWTITDAYGNFSFDSLPAGTYGVNPVITGLTTYPYYVTLNGNTSPAFVKMIISGLIITTTEEQETTMQGFKIYPNPTTGFISIETDENSDSYQAEIYSISGKLVKAQSLPEDNSTVDLSDLPSGLFLVKITGNKGKIHQERIIKQ